MSYLLQRERARSARVLHLDSGDVFQGAPIFNYFYGEAEMRALAETGLDAMVIGNHEFDAGGENFAKQAERWATFPLLAANYMFEPTDPYDYSRQPRLGRLAQPYTILNADGLRVGVIGLGNLSSMNSIFEQPNRLGIIPLETIEVTQFYIDLIRPYVDVVVLLTHLGLSADERMINNTSGADVVLGGHLHIVLDPPKVVQDCANVDSEGNHFIEVYDGTDPGAPATRRPCTPRPVVLAHSGAFMKFLGRLDVVLTNDPARLGRPGYDPSVDGYEVLSHRYQLFPLDSTVPEDPRMVEILEPYEQSIANLVDLDELVGLAPTMVRRFGAQGGDSPLGNLVADAMWLRLGIQTDFALTNTTGIRTDINGGAVSLEQMFNVFPFDNTVAKMFVSGREVQELFDFVARRSASRGCNSQVQIAGARVIIDCSGTSARCRGEPCAERVAIGRSTTVCTDDDECGEGLCDLRPGAREGRCLLPVIESASYELATNNYIAAGGSGFRVLQRNTTQVDTLLPQRDVLTDYIRNGAPCGADENGELPACSTDADCGAAYACACPATVPAWDESVAACFDPAPDASCPGATGRCVYGPCINSVTTFHIERQCAEAIDAIARQRCECDARADAAEECKLLSCINDDIGAVTDGRIRMRAF
jgi:5'-nucleotidase / UDP-sugar diphosphatase